MDDVISLSVVIPTVDEIESLGETVEIVFSATDANVFEVLLIIGDPTTPSTLEACGHLRQKYGGRVRVLKQSLPFLGGAFRTGIAAAKGSHIVLMFADLESDPRLVPAMVRTAAADRGSVVSASRWLPASHFVGYGKLKRLANYCFQRTCALLCHSKVTDFTYGFRVYPARMLRNEVWRETRHAFVLESILKPLLRGIPVREVPATWTRRREGKRRSRFNDYSHYVATLLTILLDPRWLNSHVESHELRVEEELLREHG